ncbi:hypothetical protein J6590_040796 [Homalodisca vitripennis]|nr:hypothetical protein J6590_040796 [Homalodisca vitripennis]
MVSSANCGIKIEASARVRSQSGRLDMDDSEGALTSWSEHASAVRHILCTQHSKHFFTTRGGDGIPHIWAGKTDLDRSEGIHPPPRSHSDLDLELKTSTLVS